MDEPKVSILKTNTNEFLVKFTMVKIDNLNPMDEINEIKELIDAREKIVIKSDLKFYFDKLMVDEIRYRLARLLYYYANQGVRYE